MPAGVALGCCGDALCVYNGLDNPPAKFSVLWLTPLSRPRMSKNKVELNQSVKSPHQGRQGCGGGQPPQRPVILRNGPRPVCDKPGSDGDAPGSRTESTC